MRSNHMLTRMSTDQAWGFWHGSISTVVSCSQSVQRRGFAWGLQADPAGSLVRPELAALMGPMDGSALEAYVVDASQPDCAPEPEQQSGDGSAQERAIVPVDTPSSLISAMVPLGKLRECTPDESLLGRAGPATSVSALTDMLLCMRHRQEPLGMSAAGLPVLARRQRGLNWTWSCHTGCTG